MDGFDLWRPNPKFIGKCARCGREGLKRNMTSLYIKQDSYTPQRILCHVCPDCMLAVLDFLAVEMPEK